MYIRRTQSKGRTYYRVVENRWIDGKPTQVNVVSLGTSPSIGAAIKERERRARKLRRDVEQIRRWYPAPESLALAPPEHRKELESKTAALARIGRELSTLGDIYDDVPPFVERAGGDALVPTKSGPLRLPDWKAVDAIRAGLSPEVLAKYNEEVEGYVEAVEDLRRIDDYDDDAQEDIRRLAELYIENGGPETAVPCPDCKDENGVSWGHDRSHPLWPKMCPRCHWHGYTGFGIADEASANQVGLPR